MEASQDTHGTVLLRVNTGGLFIFSNKKQFGEAKNPRSRAKWESAVRQLCTLDLLDEAGYKGEVFRMTDLGYKVADAIRRKPE